MTPTTSYHRPESTDMTSTGMPAMPGATDATDAMEVALMIDTTCVRMPNGDLVIRLTPTANCTRIRWMRERFGSAYALAAALEYQRAHGWAWVMPSDIGNLTYAPMLTDEGWYDACSQRLKIWGSLWWYPDFRTCDPVLVLLSRGAVVFRPLVMRRNRVSLDSKGDHISQNGRHSQHSRHGQRFR